MDHPFTLWIIIPIGSCKEEGWNYSFMLRLQKVEPKNNSRQTSLTQDPECHWWPWGNQFFSLLDQSKVYHQLHLNPESRRYSAFIIPWGIYGWVWAPFGLMNASAWFQIFVEQCLDGCCDDIVIPYLEDLLIYSSLLNEHLQHLKIGFQRLEKFGIKIKAWKCKTFRRQISYLGRLISSEGYTTNPKNILAVTSKINKKLKISKELWNFLGLVGYLRRYIPNFSKTASPLYQLLKG